MKTQLSALEINKIVEELQFLIDAKLDKLYQPEKKELLLQFHKTGSGRQMLKIILGESLFLTKFKKENPEMKHSFCLSARKKLLNARLRGIKQLGFERIVEFKFQTKENTYRFIAELFSKGNAVITDENNKILSCLEVQLWKDRTIKPREIYRHPEKEYNFLELTEEELKKAVETSKKQNIVKMLAIDLGLGGVYAEELCLDAGIDKEKKKLDGNEVKKLFKAIEKLREKQINPLIIREKEKIIDIIPFELDYYKDFKSEKRGNFNEALDEVFTKREIVEIKEEKSEKKQKELEKIKKTIRIQEEQLKGLEKSAEENQRKGELIYEKYRLIEDILNQIKEARKTMSWKEIKEKLKGKKLIKNIDEKKGEVTVDI